jgi:hypothetical protein
MGLGRIAAVLGILLAAAFLGAPDVAAQPPTPQTFQIEWKKRTDPHLRPGIEGWVTNPTNYRVGSMQLKVQTVDAANQVTAERKVWVYGHVPPTGRAFFVIPLAPSDSGNYRILVDSFDLIALESN